MILSIELCCLALVVTMDNKTVAMTRLRSKFVGASNALAPSPTYLSVAMTNTRYLYVGLVAEPIFIPLLLNRISAYRIIWIMAR